MLENISGFLWELQFSSVYNTTHPVVDTDETLPHHWIGRLTHFAEICEVLDIK